MKKARPKKSSFVWFHLLEILGYVHLYLVIKSINFLPGDRNLGGARGSNCKGILEYVKTYKVLCFIVYNFLMLIIFQWSYYKYFIEAKE